MFKGLRCKACDRKIKKKFDFCPTCGFSLRGRKRKEQDNGMLGIDDMIGDMKLPFGMKGIMNGLVKQLNKELNSVDLNDLPEGQRPKGFKIQISTGKPQMKNSVPVNSPAAVEEPTLENAAPEISSKEASRRQKLKRVDAVSSIRRLPEAIVYEISTPGVKHKKEVVVAKLEDAIEVRAYSKDKCYEKIIPIKAELISYMVKDEKILLKLKG